MERPQIQQMAASRVTVTTPLIGRFGNQLFQWAYSKAYSEKFGHKLRTPRWTGEKIFQIEPTEEPDGTEMVLGGYAQNQEALIYTRRKVREWFRFRPEIESQLQTIPIPKMVFHRRTGDYAALGYVVVSLQSYLKSALFFGYGGQQLSDVEIVSAESPFASSSFSGELSFLPDFYRMMRTPVLFRANSTFSYWSAVLADDIQRIYSPVIDGIPGGKEQDVSFVSGNHSRFANLPCLTDLYLSS
jgi:hypothetical protein